MCSVRNDLSCARLWARRKDIAPRLRERVGVALEKAAPFGRWCGIELLDAHGQSPRSRGLDWMRVALADFGVRWRGGHCLHARIGRQRSQCWTSEVNHE